METSVPEAELEPEAYPEPGVEPEPEVAQEPEPEPTAVELEPSATEAIVD